VAKVKQRKGPSDRGATRTTPPARRAKASDSTSGSRPRGRGAAKDGAAEVVRQRSTLPARAVRKPGAVVTVPKRATRPADPPAATAGAAPRGRARKGGAEAAERAAATRRRASATVLAKRGTSVISGRGAGRALEAPERVVKIKELDPLEKCGPHTSVTELYRVDETLGGSAATHLVFFDRHGWYCEHGRSCRAVEDVRKLGKSAVAKSLVRTISVG
jgi:hypothetical protein